MTDTLRMLVSCSLLLAGCSPTSGPSPSVPGDAATGETCAVLASVPYWVQEEAIASFDRNIDLIDYVTVFWYHLAPDGSVRKYVMADESRALIERAQQHGVKVLALIANLPDDEREDDRGTWDARRVGRVIGSEASRAAHIEELMALTRRMNFDGLYIDYEELPGTYRQGYTRFIEGLAAALHAEDKLLAVALHPKTSEDNPLEDNGSAAQDWDALHPHVDQLHIMTYSEHTSDTPPGPVASAGWVEQVLRYAVVTRRVPPAKIYMGVPLYAEEWYRSRAGRYRGIENDLMFADAQRIKRERRGTEKWSAEHASPYVVYHDEQLRPHVIWFENERSSAHKLAIGNQLGLCKLSTWRLGGEDPGFWDLVRESRTPARSSSGTTPRKRPTSAEEEPDQADDEDGGDQQEQQDDGEDTEDDGEDTEDDGEDTEDDGEDTEDDSENPEDDGEDTEAEAASASFAPWTRRLSVAGETSASVEVYSAFATTDPAHRRENWMVYLDSAQTLALSPRLDLESDVRVVLESDGEDERFYTDFPHEGLYVKKLVLRHATERYSFFAGKYELAADIRGHAPIFFGNHSVDLSLSRRLGAGASATLTHATLGQHTLTGHLFHADTTRLRGEVFTGQDRNGMYDGRLARTGRPDSFLVTLNGGTTGEGAGIAYTLGAGRQQNGDPAGLDEQVYLGALKGNVPLGRYGALEPSIDLLSLHDAGGAAGDTRNLLLGLSWSGAVLTVGGAYSIRFGAPGFAPDGRQDHIGELLARYDIGRGFSVEAAYQNIREDGAQDNLFGIVLGYMRDWLVPRA
jgi:spore germination protein